MARGFVASRDRAELERLVQVLGGTPSAEQLAELGRYLELVSSWNAKLDLTAAKDGGALIEVMLGDAVVLAGSELIPEGNRCVDVGSGAGAPGLPLAVLRSDLALVLVEPLRKRVAFLRTALGSLKLAPRVQVLEQKIDPDSPSAGDGRFDLALSRATFAPETWLPAGLALAPRALVLLASQAPPELPGAVLERELSYTLPFSGAARRIACYRRG